MMVSARRKICITTIKAALHRKQEVVNIIHTYAAVLSFFYNTFSYGVLVCVSQSPSGLLLLFQV